MGSDDAWLLSCGREKRAACLRYRNPPTTSDHWAGDDGGRMSWHTGSIHASTQDERNRIAEQIGIQGMEREAAKRSYWLRWMPQPWERGDGVTETPSNTWRHWKAWQAWTPGGYQASVASKYRRQVTQQRPA